MDAPNLICSGATSACRGIHRIPVLDVRTGFPLSVVDEDRNFVGPRNEVGRAIRRSSPLDLQVSKRLVCFVTTPPSA